MQTCDCHMRSSSIQTLNQNRITSKHIQTDISLKLYLLSQNKLVRHKGYLIQFRNLPSLRAYVHKPSSAIVRGPFQALS